MGVPVYRTASTVPQYTDISVYRYTPTIHRHGLFYFESTFRISVFLGFSEKMAVLEVGRFKWILCCPLFILFYFIFFFGRGGLFKFKFKLFFIVFSAISNIFLKRLRFH